MRIAILSRGPKLYSTRRLRDAAKARGHTLRVLDTLRFFIHVEAHEPELFYDGKAINHYDAVIPRIGASITFFGTAVVRQFEQMGVYCQNSSSAISVSRDKLRSLQILSRHNIGMPPSVFVRNKKDILPAIEEIGGAPVIIKLLEGTQGMGVILADSTKIAEAIIETLQTARQNVLIQKFVAESKGRDVRAFVVGGRVVAAMRRTAQGQEFRSNVHRGGRTESLTLDEDYERTAVKAAHIMGLRVAGVDMLESNEGPQVMEVNSSPGLEGIERATGLDVASAIIEDLEQEAKFPDFDIRQRLTFSKGYGVAEITISKDSELAGQTLAEASLRDRDIQVLCITRNELVIPNPSGLREIMPGDTLLCYGKQIALQALIPTKKSKRKKRRVAGATKKP
ncbi:MAG: 30S ribosomal protein S6--L-glutamate ligase [Phycisphaerales bacterium]|nr:MAG: 30S ribosomal protein S6--L-glutamate ligase [Phycisphaerales bacterium]